MDWEQVEREEVSKYRQEVKARRRRRTEGGWKEEGGRERGRRRRRVEQATRESKAVLFIVRPMPRWRPMSRKAEVFWREGRRKKEHRRERNGRTTSAQATTGVRYFSPVGVRRVYIILAGRL